MRACSGQRFSTTPPTSDQYLSTYGTYLLRLVSIYTCSSPFSTCSGAHRTPDTAHSAPDDGPRADVESLGPTYI